MTCGIHQVLRLCKSAAEPEIAASTAAKEAKAKAAKQAEADKKKKKKEQKKNRGPRTF
eukprot:CAMPEP_0113379110 /NCGR_PEP_ID=MMETSP0013_2-20120614/4054_1 /TAXON_ID=2843 ORGANISM="Skeletonema costatum, Strain 1716" /NCGR_SAMPLE_ID=MMETSP0013_2 /ASSEMBLY_ACC=CAM_ASM_000158 /LENGTH=57 /DNA_ID=CAMNT_0000261369 /DNA_START=633 /DNA_END=806 /DNA_ORIENTATION=+ /assembly_acc=CAM_ASM_000158